LEKSRRRVRRAEGGEDYSYQSRSCWYKDGEAEF
jgi:hypothetical protein